MEKRMLLSTSPAADVFASEDETKIVVVSKDMIADETGERTEEVPGKGAVCSRMTAHLYRVLETGGIRTAFVEEVTDTESVFRRVEEIPLLVTVRNYSAGNYPERTGLKEGTALPVPTAEFHCTKEGLGMPLINGYDALAMKLVNEAEIEEIVKTAFRVNEVLSSYFEKKNTDLIDVSVRFGRNKKELVVTGGLSPDTMRLWDRETHEKLDADRFRKSLGNVGEAYREVFRRLGISGEQ